MAEEADNGVPGLRSPVSAILAFLPLVGIPVVVVAEPVPWVSALLAAYAVAAVLFWEDSRRRRLDEYSLVGFAILGVAALPLYWWKHLRPGHPGAGDPRR